MAVKINVPGVGEVTVEGIAEESTMKELLEAIRENKKTAKSDAKKQNATTKEATESAEDLSSELDKLVDESQRMETQTKKSRVVMNKFATDMSNTVNTLNSEIINFSATMASTVAAVATTFLTNYDNIAKDPISAGAEMINTAIDVTAQASKIVVGAAGGVASGILGLIPVFGSGLQKVGEAATEASKAVIDFAAQVTKTANAVLAKEFEKTVTAMNQFNTAGASFAGGMEHMRNVAVESGLGVSDFAAVVSKNTETLRRFGMSASQSAQAMSTGLSALTKTVKGTSVTYRQQLLALGYSYEEQGDVMALFINQARIAGKDIRNIAPTDLANGVKEYAKNLKVISDITGQDAKQLMAKAQAEAARGAMAGKLNEQQNKAFQDAWSSLAAIGPKMAPQVQTALTQLMAGQAVSDPIIAGNKQMMDMLQKVAGGVMSGNTNMIENTQSALAAAAEEYRKTGESATDMASLFGVNSPIVQGFADLGNALRAYMPGEEQAKKSMNAAQSQMEAADEMTKSFQNLTEQSRQFQIQLEKITLNMLPGYSKMLADAHGATVEAIQDAIALATGKMTTEEYGKKKGLDVDKIKEDAEGWWDKLKIAGGVAGAGWFAGSLFGAGSAGTAAAGTAAAGTAAAGTAAAGTAAAGGAALASPAAMLAGSALAGYGVGELINMGFEKYGDKESVGVEIYKLVDRMQSLWGGDDETKMRMQEQTELMKRMVSSMEKNNRLTSGIASNTA